MAKSFKEVSHVHSEHDLSTVLWHAQKRFAGDTRDMLQQWMEGKPFKEENYIVREGKLAPQYT